MSDLLKKHPKLRGFTQHGAAFRRVVGGQAEGDCPFCDSEKHLFVNVDTRAWDCKSCGRHGGFSGWLAQRAETLAPRMRGTPILALAEDVGVKPPVLRAWGVAWDGTYFLVPVAGGAGATLDLRRYRLGKKVISTAGGRAGLMCATDAPRSRRVWLCEGFKDGVAWDEVLRDLDISERVYAVPGAATFPAQQAMELQGNEVVVAFDNDDAGRRGAARVAELLVGVALRVRFVKWPEKTPEGHDVRDLVATRGGGAAAYRGLQALVVDALPAVDDGAAPSGGAVPTTQPTGGGLPRDDVLAAYRKWLYLPGTMVEAVDVLYGTLLANRLDGDPVWLFLVGPPGCGKTELLMTFQEAPLTMTTTSLTPHALVSGAATAGGGDPSLIPRLNGKVLVIKDFTTILTMHYTARDEIFGVLRDAYDGRTEKFFGHGVYRVYESRFGIAAGVTQAIEAYGNTSLGERFVLYRIRHAGHLLTGSTIIQRALGNIAKETGMREELRAVAARALDRAVSVKDIPEISTRLLRRFEGLAQWVAALRGMVAKERYTREVLVKPVPEIATRLAKQLAKLAIGVAIFRREDVMSDESYIVAAHVARDTVPGRAEEVVRALWLRCQDGWASAGDIAGWVRLPPATVTSVLNDLYLLRVVQKKRGKGSGLLWQLARALVKLMKPLNIYADEARIWRKKK